MHRIEEEKSSQMKGFAMLEVNIIISNCLLQIFSTAG